MTVPSGYQRVDVPFERRAEFFTVDQWAFATAWPSSVWPLFDNILDWSRARAVEVTDSPAGASRELAGVHASFGYTMKVPGGTVATSGLTWVGVHPAHRRRGILRSMIEDHFTRSLGRGEAVSTLIAAEPDIYQRFGYGLACRVVEVTLPAGVKMRGESDETLRVRLEDIDLAVHENDIRTVLARDARPGAMVDVSAHLIHDQVIDPEIDWHDTDKLRIAIVEDADGPAAFAIFRRKLEWKDGKPDGSARTSAWAAATTPASRRLWNVLTSFDLIGKTKIVNMTIDDPLMHSVTDMRALDARFADHLWLRVLDVPAALEARGYSADADVVVNVIDEQIAENSYAWHINVVDGVARVTRAERDVPVDAEMSIQELSAAYLGGVGIAELAAAGLVQERRAGAVAQLDAAFASPLQPRSTFFF